MAVDTITHPRNSDAPDVDAEDILPVSSRISWGAILAGAVLALALYFLLTLLGAAIGLSVSDDTSARSLGTGAAIWAVLVTALCLFAGGYAASHFTVGESKAEAAVYGMLVWAVVFAMLLWLMASGVRAGFGAMVSVATAGGAAVGSIADAVPGDALSGDALKGISAADVERFAKQAGVVDQAQIDSMKRSAEDFAAEAQDPAARREARQSAERTASEAADKIGSAATTAAWWAFGGTLLSMLAAVGGGALGAGPRFRLFPVGGVRRATV